MSRKLPIRNLLCRMAGAWLGVTILISAAPAEAPTALVECADGSLIPGTFAADTSWTIAGDDGDRQIAARDVLRLSVSALRENESRELESAVAKLRDALASEEIEERESATRALLAMPGAIAPALKRLLSDPDPEVGARARFIMDRVASKSNLQDARDLVVTGGAVFRGWLKQETFELQTALGPVSIPRPSIRTLFRLDDAGNPLPAGENQGWPPPLAEVPAATPGKDTQQAVIFLKGGWRLVGETAKDVWEISDESGSRVDTGDLVGIEEAGDVPGVFVIHRKHASDLRWNFAAKQVAVTAASRSWTVPVRLIQSVEFGPYRRGSSLTLLVAQFEQAKARGEPPPGQRFWVAIHDQPANPWNTNVGKAMTWVLVRVEGKACLVGQDQGTDAYRGDTLLDEELPILCIHQGEWPVPAGLDVSGQFNGWSGGEIRLTQPVKGKELNSPEAAQAIIERELGKGWEMAEHHQPGSGGWRFWAYWEAPPAEGK